VRTARLLFAMSILLAGCYSQSALMRDDPVPGNQTVVFYLTDGSSVESMSGNHSRSIGGYQVEGTLFKHGNAQGRFAGMIHDDDIEKVTAEQLDMAYTTVAAVASVAVFAALFVVLIPSLSIGHH
jgi:hypothetical protein